MKKLITLLMILLIATGCAKASTNDSATTKIAVLQLMDHEALNNTYQGFVDALKDNGLVEGENLSIEFQNPNNDKSALATMAQVIVNNEPDLILAIGTASAQSIQQETTSIPVLGSAITDYVDVGLVESVEKPGKNISGASDYCDMAIQMDLIETIVPDVKTVGLLYTSSEENSIIQANIMKEECAKRGWNVLEKTISDLTMVDDTMHSLVGKVDALYIPTDNPLASSMASVEIVASENKLPVIVGCDTMVADGGLASIGVNYYNLGYETGLQAISVLNGKVNISELPIYYMDGAKADVYYNSHVAKKAGIEIPQSLIDNGIDMAK